VRPETALAAIISPTGLHAGPRLERAGAPDVNKHRPTPFRGLLEDLDDLEARCPWRVFEPHSDA
jgi:hypothetical protein